MPGSAGRGEEPLSVAAGLSGMAVPEVRALKTEEFVEASARQLRPEQLLLLARLPAHLERYAKAYRLMA